MTRLKRVKKQTLTLFVKCFPILFTLLIFFLFPPVALALVIAFFTAPLLNAIYSVTKLPLTLSTLLVIIFICFMTFTFFYIGLQGIIEIIPVIEAHLTSISPNVDYIEKGIEFLKGKVNTYGQALLDYTFTIIQTVVQQFVNVVIFFITYFFALRESGKSRYWFLIYFPVRFRKQAKHTLKKASQLIGTFIYVEAKLVFITFLILLAGFSLLRFTSPLGLALLISLVDSLPFLGIGLFLIPMIVYFFYSGNLWIGVSLLVLYIGAAVTRQFAESYMWASTFQLKPIHAFLILACAVYAFGFIGILLSPFFLFAAFKVKQHPLFNE